MQVLSGVVKGSLILVIQMRGFGECEVSIVSSLRLLDCCVVGSCFEFLVF